MSSLGFVLLVIKKLMESSLSKVYFHSLLSDLVRNDASHSRKSYNGLYIEEHYLFMPYFIIHDQCTDPFTFNLQHFMLLIRPSGL